MHILKQIKFLVSKSSKSGLACLGGAWSSEKDGGGEGSTGPGEQALIRAAIRHTKDAIDMDLSKVKIWFKFMEVHYHRPAEVYRGKSFPEQEEVSTFFVPFVWEVMPSLEEYEARLEEVRKSIDSAAMAEWMAKRETDTQASKASDLDGDEHQKPEASKAASDANQAEGGVKDACGQGEDAKPNEAGEGKTIEAVPTDGVDAGGGTAPSTLDVSDGTKPKESEESRTAEEETSSAARAEASDPPTPCVLDAPAQPCLICRPRLQPEMDVKSQMKLQLISLDGMLDYNLEDIMEKTFEVSLFAELFVEMLQFKAASTILASLDKAAKDAAKEEATMREAALDLAAGLKRKAEAADREGGKKVKTEEEGGDAGGADAGASLPGVDELEKEYVTVQKDEIEGEEQFHMEEVFDTTLRTAWQLFDRGNAQYIRSDDVEQIIHNIGQCLSRKQVSSTCVLSSRILICLIVPLIRLFILAVALALKG